MRVPDLTRFEGDARNIEAVYIPQIEMARDWAIESIQYLRSVSTRLAERHFSRTNVEPRQFGESFEQATINLSFVQLFHLLEQQITLFVRNKQPGLEYGRLEELLQAVFVHYGFDVTFFESWPAIQELRLIANTVKHSEARDAEKLRQIRPQLFVHPSFDAEHAAPFVRAYGRQKFPAELAMMGEGFYPTLSVYEDNVSAVLAFWKEFCAVIRGEKRELRTLGDWVKQHRCEIVALAEKHGASNVRVFGSVARGEAGPASDVDLLVDFEKGTSFGTELDLIEKLQELLGRKVDLGTFESLKPRLKERATREAIPL